ncbi:MAG: YdeI/OmpD-associated family protein [Candidatus Limnocylindria bacterium]
MRIFAKPADFRAWLEANHERAADLWVGYYKKGVAKQSVSYPESVEEALCFGWIDGITRRIDDEVYATRFTPRRKGSNWSGPNIAKVAELTEAGRMHPAGIRTFQARDRRRDPA